MPEGIRVGLYVPNFGAFASPLAVADLAVRAEAAGWDGLFLWDHVVRREGPIDVADPWVTLAAVATVTERIVLGPLVTPLPRRRPWNVARAVATLDHLSAGRAVLGVGTGTPRGPEFTAFGEEPDLRVRGDMLDEGLAVVRAAWSGGEVHHRGAHYRVDGAAFLPRPLQTPLPIWAATESVRGRAVRRAAGLDGVVPIGLEPDQVAELVEGITAARTGVGGRYDVVTAGTDGPERWLGSGLTWWLRLLAWDAPIAEALAEVAAGPH